MVPYNVKLPAEVRERLRIQAERMNCHQAALARDLICWGLVELEK